MNPDLVMYKVRPGLTIQPSNRESDILEALTNSPKRKALRESAVRKAWTLERRLLLGTGQGTRDWTFRQKIELFKTGKIARFEHENIDWQREQQDILETSRGSRSWTHEEKISLFTNKRVSGFDGHHINDVHTYGRLLADPRNIRFLTEEEHSKSNQGHRDLGTKTSTKGRFIDRQRTLESFLRTKASSQYKKAQQEARQGQKGGGGGRQGQGHGQGHNPDSPPPSPRGPPSRSQSNSTPSSNASEYLKRVCKLNPIESLKKSVPNNSSWQKLTSFQDSVKSSTLKTAVAQFRSGGASGYPIYDKPGGIDLTTKSQDNTRSAPVKAGDFGLPFSGTVKCMEVVAGKDEDDQSFIKASLLIDTSSPQKVYVKLPLNISYEELETLKNASTNGDGVLISCILGQGKDIQIETLGNIEGSIVEEVLTEADLDLANIAWGKNTYTQDLHVSPVESYVNPYLEEIEFADKDQQAFAKFHHILMQPTLYLPRDPKFSAESKGDKETEYIAKMQTCPLVWTTRGIYYDYQGNTIYDDKFELKLWWEPLLKDIEDKWDAYIQSYANLARVADYARAICFLDLCKRSSLRVSPKHPDFTSLKTHTLSNVIDDCPEEMSELQNYHSKQLFIQVLTESDPWARLSKLTEILPYLETPELKWECLITILNLAMDPNIKAIIDQGKALQRKQIIGNVLKYLAFLYLTTDSELTDSLEKGLSDDNRQGTCVPLTLLAEAIVILTEIGDLSNALDAINLLGDLLEFPPVPPLTASSSWPSSQYSNPSWNVMWDGFFSSMSRGQTEQAKHEFHKIRNSYECTYMTWNRELLDKLESKCEGKNPKDCLSACHQLVQALEHLPAGLEEKVRAKLLTKTYERIAQLTQDPILKKTWLIKANYWRKLAPTSKLRQNSSQKSVCNMF